MHPLVKEALKSARSHLTEKKNTRTRESVTEDEIAMLEEKYLGQDLPTDESASWVYTGFCYQNESSFDNERCY